MGPEQGWSRSSAQCPGSQGTSDEHGCEERHWWSDTGHWWRRQESDRLETGEVITTVILIMLELCNSSITSDIVILVVS